MARRYTRSNNTAAELVADYLKQREQDVIQALATTGAFVAQRMVGRSATSRATMLNPSVFICRSHKIASNQIFTSLYPKRALMSGERIAVILDMSRAGPSPRSPVPHLQGTAAQPSLQFAPISRICAFPSFTE